MTAACYLLTAGGPAVALVVCVGADGQRGIESALAQECCTEEPERAVPMLSRSERSCDCTDTPLVVEGTLRSKPQVEVPRAPMRAALVPAGGTASRPLVGPALCAVTASKDPPSILAALRSVVLLV
jgi:hypothetical protein